MKNRGTWILGALCLVATARAAASRADAPAIAEAGGELYAHPLLTEEGGAAFDALVALGYRDSEAMVARLTWGSAIEEAADGTVVEDGSFVAVLDIEVDDDVAEPVEPDAPALWVSPELDAALGDAAGGPVEVMLALDQTAVRTGPPTLADAVARDILDGLILTEADAELTREEFLLGREEEGLEPVAALGAAVEACGGRVVWESPRSLMVDAWLSPACLAEVEQHPGLASVTPVTEGEPDAGHSLSIPGPEIDGIELEDLLQSTAFYNAGYQGSANLGLVEHEGFKQLQDNLGFEDGSGSLRIHPMECLLGTVCWDTINWDPGNAHANATVSLLVGDLTQGQDPTLTTSTAQRDVSGVARGSEVWVGHHGVAVDVQTLWLTYGTVRIGSMSASYPSDPACEGRDGWSVAWNDMFESGVALFKSAGNAHHTSATDCTVGSPGSALGVFAVGAADLDEATSLEVIHPFQSRGGTTTEGRGRTILGATGPSGMDFAYPHYTWPTDPTTGAECHYGPDWGAGPCRIASLTKTSASTPAVAGGAELVRDWFTTERNADLNAPGALYATLLLMGDRTDEFDPSSPTPSAGLPTATPKTTGYDNLWGAGQVRLRMFNSGGADNPFRYEEGNTCVTHGATVTIPMTPNSTMPQDVGILKASAWWYDHRHDVGTDNDQVKLQIKEGTVTVATDNGTDNRARASLDSVTPGALYYLKLTGTSVTSDLEGCGANATRVFWAYYWEDEHRDDGDDSDLARTE